MCSINFDNTLKKIKIIGVYFTEFNILFNVLFGISLYSNSL